jgi:type I restriction enzyme, R subunit
MTTVASPTNFAFLQADWPPLFSEARRAEVRVYYDPRASCFYARRALEMLVHWAYKSDSTLKLPYQDNLSALLHEPSFFKLLGPAVHAKAVLINRVGNSAVHDTRPVTETESFNTVRELFHVAYWLARTYSRSPPAVELKFNADLLRRATPTAVTPSELTVQTHAKLLQLEADLRARDARLKDLLGEHENLLTGKLELDAELERLRAEVAEARRQNQARPDTHDYSEAETRDAFIDLLLRESGWSLEEGPDQPKSREYPVTGMPNPGGEGFVDYVLWGDDGKPLGLVEAKRTRRDAHAGQQQAKLYADCLEAKFHQRPVIFYTNGYEHWIWDDAQYPPRPVSGFYTQTELALLIQRRASRKKLASVETDKSIAERYYQERAIRNIAKAFEQHHQRKALLVMATGAGKTRTVIALSDVLMRANWAKRILFLADRVALVKQAANAFKKHLPGVSPVNLVTEKDQEGRVYISTYPTMMGLIDEMKDGARRFGPGHFDLIVVDEAHRSIYRKYGAIFDYFDALLVGLTATPKNEIDRNTYGLFALERGVPTDEYGLTEAVDDGFLVPYEPIAVPLKFPREGIRYDDLSDEEKDQWDALEWNEEGEIPDHIDGPSVNQWLFNESTVDLVLEHLMRRGVKVANGDRLGKTIIFAKNHNHAQYIAERFDHHYPHLKGSFARVIDFKVNYAQSLIDDFSQPEKNPHIAISVDMLDTGIDIPEIVNLAFFKIVRSKTKFWQMIGRGTRLSPNLFGPGRDKTLFRIFDYCQNLEYFSMNPDATDGALPESLGKKLFRSRVELLTELDRAGQGGTELRTDTAELLRGEVAAMNVDNFIVRPQRRLVERYADAGAWAQLNTEAVSDLLGGVVDLPSALIDLDEDARQFDLLMLRLQLTVLRGEPGFETLQGQVMGLALLLEEKAAIPMVAAQLALLQEIQTDAFWEGIDVAQLEDVRRKVRSLVKLIERAKRNIVYTSFDDELGEEIVIPLLDVPVGVDVEKLRAKAQEFLKKHEQDAAIQRLKWNEPLTAADLLALEQIFAAEGTSAAGIEEAKRVSHGLGLFVRSLVGLDRAAAKRSFASFLDGKTLTANQIEFVALVIDHLARRGWIDPSQLYESPFIDLHPSGVDGIFNDPEVREMLTILTSIRQNAEGREIRGR